MASSGILPHLQRAMGLHQAGRNAEAWTVLFPLRSAIDRDGQALRLYALVAQATNRLDEAIASLKQITALERDPPEILGALADMLGNAGLHEEALTFWDRLVAKHPGLADAHLNRAIAAASAGDQRRAIAAADEGLKRFPGHARLLAVKALALKDQGRITEAVTIFEQAVASDPLRSLTRHNQAVALRAACRFDDACDAFAEAERLGLSGAQFRANWAAAALEADRVDQAEELYRQALAEDGSHEEARKGLTRLKMEYRGGEGAFAHYETAARERPRDPKAWFDWSNALIVNRRLDDARVVAERGLAANPGSNELRATAAFAEGMTGDASAALAELERLVASQRSGSELNALVPQIALRAGRPDRAAEFLERATTRDPLDQVSWSLLGLAWRLLDDPREQWLCDYERLVMVTDLPSIDGMAPADYARFMASVLDQLHVTISEPGDQSLRGGTQTPGALFSRPEKDVQDFREAVSRAAAEAVAKLPDDPAHPFLRRKSSRFGFSGSWSVRLKAGGHHVSHVHPEGWMSSAYYARLPDADSRAERSHEGWIQFGVPPEYLGIELTPRRIVQPRPGRLVLFPSFMWHGTIPFQCGDRLTAAFDYQPL